MAEKGGVQSVERIFQLIEHLAAHPTGVTIRASSAGSPLAADWAAFCKDAPWSC